MGKQIQNFTEKIGLYSFYFYGLVLLIIIIISRQQMASKNEININEIKRDEKKKRLVTILLIFLIFGLTVPLNSFLMRIDGIRSYIPPMNDFEKQGSK